MSYNISGFTSRNSHYMLQEWLSETVSPPSHTSCCGSDLADRPPDCNLQSLQKHQTDVRADLAESEPERCCCTHLPPTNSLPNALLELSCLTHWPPKVFSLSCMNRQHFFASPRLRYVVAVDRLPARCAVPSVLRSNPPPARGSCTPSSTSWAVLSPASCCPAPSPSSSGKMWVPWHVRRLVKSTRTEQKTYVIILHKGHDTNNYLRTQLEYAWSRKCSRGLKVQLCSSSWDAKTERHTYMDAW